MSDIFNKTFMMAARGDAPKPQLTRVRDMKKWPAPTWWRSKSNRRPARYIDLNDL